jgi:hypothetical protein
MLRESPEFKRGRNGERIVAQLLKRLGWFIVPSYDYSGEDGNKAPRMEGHTAAFVLPDLDISRAADRRWAEVKTKTRPTLYRKTGKLQHGISARQFEHYRAVERETGCPVCLFIFEENTRLVLTARLNELGNGRRALMGQSEMMFWDRDAFRTFTKLAKNAA